MTGINGISGPTFQNTNTDNVSKPNQASEYQQYIVETQQKFNTMLNDLVSGSDEKDSSSDSSVLSSLISDTSSLTASQTSTMDSQRLAALEQTSSLLGQEVIYYDQTTGSQATGTVDKVLVSNSAVPTIVLTDGRELPVASLVGIKRK
ncbi:hypothetical protein A3K48_00355 [candidate division WOR-1 bacterium RIFOXYA12_FULL_52_29]|uniref:Flagellar hook capping protein n=1 Tax=candidate division WOR-1 bacterium RIFOXYC12_FULL_54_18 TaxID=1802584 RepID=A0A1F4T5X3_UNCSA|nr:MAG: hypothetical protein A3K44_00355 [candidate division WOR-1 bacterium RIFOXYA2_FULL_51_19]OGC17056.1 MAG: hypothetical protein A3K48_00355 [candidate division WOR-1 bacterium RIFOXYA12_FULL_52_29]OGC25917.1 MAG: hypothetical protein A3K32_00355 [candidate division WOR-1 bacterium RIFOXYB2_FULL_45_9]OGC27473.1 MAG: hypothetical protein A3K49_00355 [candidate division WOR-1 bacterium RIFOXYC12_FULL_54_18]OGC29314.1 MAG: hypothetical protein A2346_01350 [candidate division WOR-1 bacterium R